MKNDTANPDDDVLLSEHGICYKLMTEEHKVAACDVLTTAFTEGEPLTLMLKLDGEFWRQTYDLLWPVISSNGLSVVALDETSGQLVGVWAVSDDGSYDTMGCLHQDHDHVQVYDTRSSTSLLEALKGDHKKEVTDLQTQHKNHRGTTGIVVEMLAIGVHKDFGRRGIGGSMTNLLLANIQHNGYKMAWSECSSHYSMKALDNNGGRVENAIKYATFAMPGGGDDSPSSYPFHDKVQDLHDTIHLVVFRFDIVCRPSL